MSSDPPIPRQDRATGLPESASTGPRESADDTEPTADGASIVSWGGSGRAGQRGGPALTRLGRDGRLAPVVAGLGAAAVLGSLFADWIVTSMPSEGSPDDTPIELASSVADLTTFGAAYLVGVIAVIGCVALVLFGSPGVRHNARVLGLAFATSVFGLLAAITGSLDGFTDNWTVYGQLEGLTNEYGQGLVLAYLGTGGLGLALVLAGRFARRGPAERTPEDEDEAGASTGPVDSSTGVADWPWRRPRTAAEPEVDAGEDGRSAPIDLTVTPTKPFTR